ncbi:serine/threonine-protein phosphatase 6 regulatory ankyrin repeat subunit A-like [Haliotis rufescens]|uniref:serine/threonine-protein phosphatase 6 regulatory ankyrin repeat subunit A-like n=1 Tax=Haliotis rufescens TaxID=6454 RepID=UPI00201EACBA|nr:serine/threonine-protein phosphatase 6 regulatory ankyrin repeat subunit A-like [Haliotis rufescens]
MESQPEDQPSVVIPIDLFTEALKNNDSAQAISYLSDPVFRLNVSLGECLVECAKYGNLIALDFILNLHNRIHQCISYTDESNKRALHHAAMHGPLECVVRLVRAGSTVNCCDSEGYTPLLCACQGGRADIVQYLVKEGAHINSSRSYKFGETALHIAAKHGHAETVAILLDGRADINATTRNVDGNGGYTALHKAANGGHTRVIEILCMRGAILDLKDSMGKTPLHFSAEKGDILSVEIFNKCGAPINLQDERGKTPLALAVREGYPEVVKHLIRCGSDINMSDTRSLSPLHSAIAVLNYEIAESLLQAGAVINCQTNDTQESPLMVALSMGRPDLVQLMLNNGADVNLCDFKCYSPLHRSQTIGYPDTVKEELTELLLQAGGKLNARDHQGHIPLHRSIFTGSIRGRQCTPCIRLLVEAGSKLKQDTFAHTRTSPLYWLCSKGDLNIARYLVQCGWELQSESWIRFSGKTPEQTHLHRLFQILNKSVHSLKILCRAVVRETVSLAVEDAEIVSPITSLPLPQAVKNFLCLRTCEVSEDDVLMMESH